MPSGLDFSNVPQLIQVDLTVWGALWNGLLAFLAPCILPMLPVYGIYLMGEGPLSGRGPGALRQILFRILGFLLGFIPFFMLLGLGAGALGEALQAYRGAFPYVGGGLMILFGLMMLNVVPGLRVFTINADAKMLAAGGFLKTMLLGFVLAISWLSCTSPFLFNVLSMAATEGGTALRGMGLLTLYSLGLAAPFLLFMALYGRLSGMLAFLKTHQALIRQAAGMLMILLGALRILRVL